MNYREYDAKIIDVVDGDTVKVDIDLGFGIHFKVDLDLLRKQQETLDTVIRQFVIENNWHAISHIDHLNGLSNFLDACIDGSSNDC